MDRDTIKLPKFTWVAHLKDGITIPQVSDDKYKSITPIKNLEHLNVSKLVVFGLKEPIIISFPTDAKPRVFNKCRKTMSSGFTKTQRLYFFGYSSIEEGTLYISIDEETEKVRVHYDELSCQALESQQF